MSVIPDVPASESLAQTGPQRASGKVMAWVEGASGIYGGWSFYPEFPWTAHTHLSPEASSRNRPPSPDISLCLEQGSAPSRYQCLEQMNGSSFYSGDQISTWILWLSVVNPGV